jgi:hypothetical protein
MTQTHGPKFRVPKQYLKRAVVIVLPQVTTSPPSFLTTQYIFEVKVYQSPIYSVSL